MSSLWPCGVSAAELEPGLDILSPSGSVLSPKACQMPAVSSFPEKMNFLQITFKKSILFRDQPLKALEYQVISQI